MLEKNPIEELETPKQKKSLPKYLTLEQSKELLKQPEGKFKERDFCILTLFLNCGIRLSELCGINTGDIRSDHTMKVTGKGNKERIVYLNDACLDALEAYMKVRPRTGLKDRNALFISHQKNRISHQMVQHIVKQYLAEIGLDTYSTHKLRHTAATLMYQYGHVDVRVLQEILGHENLGTTQIYTHLSNRQMREAAEANPLADVKAKTEFNPEDEKKEDAVLPI
jgi:site-specific recombinase XerD